MTTTYVTADQINRALRLLGVLAEGEVPSASTSQDSLMALNQMIYSWNTERLSVFSTMDETVTWPANTATMTLGPNVPGPIVAVMVGDSITNLAFGGVEGAANNLLTTLLSARNPNSLAYDEGIQGQASGDGDGRITTLTTTGPPTGYYNADIFALSYGTNDVRLSVSPATFQANMQTMITQVQSVGKIAMIPTIPYSLFYSDVDIQALNAIIATLNTTNNLTPGPDLYTWFQNNQSQLQSDGIHPNAAGQAAICELWNDALAYFTKNADIGPNPRPISIDDATYFRDPGTGLSYNVQIVNQEQYNSITLKTVTSTYPRVLWVNMTYPNITMTVWPVPTIPLEWHFISVQPLTEPATIDTALSFPPGYLRAFTYNLACEIAPEFGIEPSPQVLRIATQAKRDIKNVNDPENLMSMPYNLIANRGRFNIYADY